MSDAPAFAARDEYRAAFVRYCFLLIVRAHRRLMEEPLCPTDEPAITGLLVKHAQELTESEDTEEWLQCLVVLDDPRQNDLRDLLGKDRPIVDIEFIEVRKAPRPRFHIEAKRLYRSDSVSEYFGEGGLRMFLRGAYASAWPSAGMMGYVQKNAFGYWLERLAKKLDEEPAQLGVLGEPPRLRPTGWSADGPTGVHQSGHTRSGIGEIAIYHLLLDLSSTVAKTAPAT
jgi:hypothetical protein